MYMKKTLRIIAFTASTLFASSAHAAPAADYVREKTQATQTAQTEWPIAYEDIARASLGQYWETASKKQKEEFVKVFTQIVKKAFVRHLEEIKGAVTEVGWETSDGGIYTVATKVKRKNPDTSTDVAYKLKKDKDTFLVVDVIVEEVSLVNGFKSQFRKTIERKGFAGLLLKMKEKLDSND
jgi:phospholipid transport system substrate-binding protein